jgi:ABC-2 type transport system ATP-binding protein
MMNNIEEFTQHRLEEVHRYFRNNDVQLGYRRLLDCAFDTNDKEVLRKTLHFCEFFEHSQREDRVMAAVSDLLSAISQCKLKASATSSAPLLTLNNVSKVYDTGGFGLRNIHLTLRTGDIVGLVGENGNGKTTLLRIIAGELKADTGTIEYHFKAASSHPYDIQSRLIYIEQRIPRWFGSLTDNLMFTLSSHGVKGEMNELRTALMIYRLGLHPFRNLTWSRISSGYKTRFELAKTLLRSPDILLLDEPLANLDIRSQQTILQDLQFMSKSIHRPFGMMLSSQHIYEVEKVSHSIIFLKQGTPYVEGGTSSGNPTPLMIEVESPNTSREDLEAVFEAHPPKEIHYNGGVFVLVFSEDADSQYIMELLAQSRCHIRYFRDISRSSSRHFIQ